MTRSTSAKGNGAEATGDLLAGKHDVWGDSVTKRLRDRCEDHGIPCTQEPVPGENRRGPGRRLGPRALAHWFILEPQRWIHPLITVTDQSIVQSPPRIIPQRGVAPPALNPKVRAGAISSTKRWGVSCKANCCARWRLREIDNAHNAEAIGRSGGDQTVARVHSRGCSSRGAASRGVAAGRNPAVAMASTQPRAEPSNRGTSWPLSPIST